MVPVILENRIGDEEEEEHFLGHFASLWNAYEFVKAHTMIRVPINLPSNYVHNHLLCLFYIIVRYWSKIAKFYPPHRYLTPSLSVILS